MPVKNISAAIKNGTKISFNSFIPENLNKRMAAGRRIMDASF
jgi:hypothetical protein